MPDKNRISGTKDASEKKAASASTADDKKESYVAKMRGKLAKRSKKTHIKR